MAPVDSISPQDRAQPSVNPSKVVATPSLDAVVTACAEPAPELSPQIAPTSAEITEALEALEPVDKLDSEEEPKAPAAKAGGKWQEFPVEKWRSAVYVNRAYFGDLCTDTTNFIVDFAEKIKLSGRRVSLVEVGCGTGEFVREAGEGFRVAVGLDFNDNFIDYCTKEIPKGKESKQRYVSGDACHLVDLMKEHFPPAQGLLWNDVRIVACVGNTIGIIPPELKQQVYKQMLELAGPDGILIMAYWNARWFGDAVENFYHANPQLCGPFLGECVDLNTCTLKTPSGYCTHWTSADEARGVMEGLGVEIISLRDQGKGVLVAARSLASDDKATFDPPSRVALAPHGNCSSPQSAATKVSATRKLSSKWDEFPVEQWRSAVYINRAYFGQLCTDTTDFIVSIAEQLKLSGRRVSLVEVGCGTGEFVRDTAASFRVAVGLDFNPNFVEYCKQEIPSGMGGRQVYVHGDACHLVDLMKEHFPPAKGLLWDDLRIVACVGNTIGIIPQEMKRQVYMQMLELAGPGGVLIMAYWNARWFGDAVQNFYHANPQLCGPFTGESIDYDTCTLQTPSGYRTHWTSAQEAREVMEGLDVEIISLRDQGKGVLVAARKL